MFLFFTLYKEEYGILFIILVTASVIYEEQLPVLNTALGNFHIIDLFLVFSLVSIFIKLILYQERKFVRTPLDIPLLLFYGITIFSAVLAVTCFSVSVRQVLSELRIITYYLVFFLVTNLIRDQKQVKYLLNGLYIIALLTVMFIAAQSILGTSLRLMPARVESLLTMGQTYTSIIRVIPPGNSLIFVMLIVACCMFVTQGSKVNIGYFIIILVLISGLIIGFNRNLWIPTILTLILFFIIAPGQMKIKFMVFSLLMLFCLMITILYTLTAGGKLQAYAYSAYDRLFSLTKGRELIQHDTLIDRIIENRYALEKIKNHPISGIGLGNSYRPPIEWNPKLNTYIHNGYLWILMKMGLFGFITFMWLLLRAIYRGFRYWNQIEDSYFKSIVIGFTLASLGFMLSAFVNPVFLQWHSTPLIGLMLGGNELIFKLQKLG